MDSRYEGNHIHVPPGDQISNLKRSSRDKMRPSYYEKVLLDGNEAQERDIIAITGRQEAYRQKKVG